MSRGDALVQVPELVKKFPDFVRGMVRRLKTLSQIATTRKPSVGKLQGAAENSSMIKTRCAATSSFSSTLGLATKQDHRAAVQ